MLTINQLMRYLRSKHHITVKKQSVPVIAQHGLLSWFFKGYRFIRTPNQRIAFSSFDEVSALNNFDMKLKALFYPKVTFIETALKSYVIEATLKDSHSENIDTIFGKSITNYRSFTPGSRNYHQEYAKRMSLRSKINSALLRDYGNKKQTVNHFFDTDRSIPIWAAFESLALGEFGTFLCVCSTAGHLGHDQSCTGLEHGLCGADTCCAPPVCTHQILHILILHDFVYQKTIMSRSS